MPAPAIRPATPDDAERIHDLIVGLAVYEREPDAVKVTSAQMRTHLAAERPPFECFVAEAGDAGVIGYALFFPIYSTWRGPSMYLEDLYVEPGHRGGGLGKALLAAVADVAVARGCARLDWAVLDWNEPSIAFYRSLGAEALSEWTTWRLTGAALHALAARGR